MTDPNRALRLMLLSNSFFGGKGYLEFYADAIRKFLGPITTILFVPYALDDWDDYIKIAREGFAKFGIQIVSIHDQDPIKAVREAQAIFIGGGETFWLLDQIYSTPGLFGAIVKRVEAGMPYIGVSAGSNLAGPTIAFTNDKPFVYPPSFKAFGFVPFVINPHYYDPEQVKPPGETRPQQVARYHQRNSTTVVGIREGSWLTIEGGNVRMHGSTGTKLFFRGKEPTEWTESDQPKLLTDFLPQT